METKQRGAEAMRQLLSLKARPDGVFCFNDPLAMGAMNYALNKEFAYPMTSRSLAAETFTTTILCAFRLSSIDQHSRQIGEKLRESRLRF